MQPRRRRLMHLLGLLGLGPLARPLAAFDYPVLDAAPLRFPSDHGAHPLQRLEWWYVTGWLAPQASPLGFQLTFFRVRPGVAEANPSRFAPRQVLFAHAALAEPRLGRIRFAQRSAREGFGVAQADRGDTRVWIDDWRLTRGQDATGEHYTARVQAQDFGFEFTLRPDAAPLLQGEQGWSRKGPEAAHASRYYSRPQLALSGRLQVARQGSRSVRGRAWLDHEWSNAYLPPQAVGWDWMGINLDDGRALMAFRMRRADGSTLWAEAGLRGADGEMRRFAADALAWWVLRWWRSPASGIAYPVALALQLDGHSLTLQPLFDDQEIDARASTGGRYWEGAVRLRGPDGLTGRGYLELTGYGAPQRV